MARALESQLGSRAPAAAVEEPDSLPRTHMETHNTSNSSSSEAIAPCWHPVALHAYGARTWGQTLTHIKINVFSKRKKGGLGILLRSEGFSSMCEALGSILSLFHARMSLCKHLRDITHNPQTSKPFNLDCVALCDWNSPSPVPALLPVPITRNSSLSSTL